MDDQIKTLPLPQRWGLSLAFSLMLWTFPLAFKAPKVPTFLSLLGSLYGLGTCITLSGEWREGDRFHQKMRVHREELENYQLALDEEATKREMVALAFGSVGSQSSVQVQELSPVQRSEPLNQAPTSHRSGSGSVQVQEVNPLNRLYTPQNLTFDEALELIRRLSQTMTKTAIVEALWQVKKGGSKAYKAAIEEFNLITQ